MQASMQQLASGVSQHMQNIEEGVASFVAQHGEALAALKETTASGFAAVEQVVTEQDTAMAAWGTAEQSAVTAGMDSFLATMQTAMQAWVNDAHARVQASVEASSARRSSAVARVQETVAEVTAATEAVADTMAHTEAIVECATLASGLLEPAQDDILKHSAAAMTAAKEMGEVVAAGTDGAVEAVGAGAREVSEGVSACMSKLQSAAISTTQFRGAVQDEHAVAVAAAMQGGVEGSASAWQSTSEAVEQRLTKLQGLAVDAYDAVQQDGEARRSAGEDLLVTGWSRYESTGQTPPKRPYAHTSPSKLARTSPEADIRARVLARLDAAAAGAGSEEEAALTSPGAGDETMAGDSGDTELAGADASEEEEEGKEEGEQAEVSEVDSPMQEDAQVSLASTEEEEVSMDDAKAPTPVSAAPPTPQRSRGTRSGIPAPKSGVRTRYTTRSRRAAAGQAAFGGDITNAEEM
jgi:hypothetical protein